MSDKRQELGAAGERAAEQFLHRQHYTIVARNYRCRSGEIDLIALEGTTVVFIEVKTRTQIDFGTPFEAINARKRKQIIGAARYYMLQKRLHDRDVRFDVVGVWWEHDTAHCELIRNAFIS